MKIGKDCLKGNANIVLDLYQDIMIRHVIADQIKDKHLGRLLRGNPGLEDDTSRAVDVSLLAGKVARSSLLGQDPWGDKELPKAAEADESESSSSEKAAKSYTEMQALLKSIQDNVWLYLTVHLQRILDQDILVRVIKLQLKYAKDADGIRTKTARKRMPWSVYRDTVLEVLPEGTGLHELITLMALCREDGDTPELWIQRLAQGKLFTEEAGIQLSDKLYVNLGTRYLTDPEVTAMATKLTNADPQKQMDPLLARRKIDKLSWSDMVSLLETSIPPGSKKYKKSMHRHLAHTRLFTLEQAREYLRIYESSNPAAPVATTAGPRRRKGKATCDLCEKAGLTGKYLRHRTENCIERIRRLNVKNMNASKSRKRGREQASNLSNTKRSKRDGAQRARKPAASEEECTICKNQQRPYRHPQKTCNYAPGGPWHKKSGEELRALQKKFYEQRKRARGGRSQTNSAIQAAPIGKRARTDEEAEEKWLDATWPLWRRQISLLAEAELRPNLPITKDRTFPLEEFGSAVRCNTTPHENLYPGVDFSSITAANVQDVMPNGSEEVPAPRKVMIAAFESMNAQFPEASLVENPNSAIVPWKESKEEEGKEEAGQMEFPYLPTQAEFRALDDEVWRFHTLQQRRSQSAFDARMKWRWFGEDYACHNHCKSKSCPPSSVSACAATQTAFCPIAGDAENPIDLTQQEAGSQQSEQTREASYMIQEDEYEDSSSDETGESDEDYSEENCTYLNIEPCGPDGVPYPDCGRMHYWDMDEPMWLFMDFLRVDYPIWGPYFRLVLANGNIVEIDNKPADVGLKRNGHTHAREIAYPG